MVKRPNPTEIKEALQDWIPSDSKLIFRPGWKTRGRPWTNGIRGAMLHHWAGMGDGGQAWMEQVGTSDYPYCNSTVRRDGRIMVLSALSAWHSGTGGPWARAGVPRDLAHLSVWGIEMEGPKPGTPYGKDDMTDEQWKSVSQLVCALRDVAGKDAFPNFSRVIRHRDWTDGTGGVAQYDLPTIGRKSDVYRGIRPIREEAVKRWRSRRSG